MLKSLHDYSLSELTESLEKSILIQNSEQAILISIEIFIMDNDKFIYSNLIESLMIIFLKYTSIASLNLFQDLDPLFDILLDRENSANKRLENLISIVLTLSKNNHTNVPTSLHDMILEKYQNEDEENDINILKDNLYNSIKKKEFKALYYAEEIDKRNDISLEDKIKLIFHTFEDVYYSEGLDIYDHTELYTKWYSKLNSYSDRYLIYYNLYLVRILNKVYTGGEVYPLKDWKKITKIHLENDEFKLQEINRKDITFDFKLNENFRL